MHFQRSKAGFTFVELLVVMVLAVTLYAVVLGPSEATVRKREMAQCAEHLRKLHLTLSLYANEHNGEYPALKDARRTEEVFRLLVPKYTSDETFLTCAKEGGRYTYAMGLKKKDGVHLLAADRLTSHLLKPGAPLFSKHGNHGESGNLLFTDGRVEVGGTNVTRDLSLPPEVSVLNP